MPQMSPLNWLSLMLFFIMILLWFNSFNYFIFKNINKNEFKIKSMKTQLNWKW
uniref:ATP synthase complex subunit 8 n=1 Tax=Brentidae sp. GENSP01 TaxID=1205806 RepID=A0A0S2MQR6_9CUCU|nr:ATP synthase F0 subunit 8 [Brentidae sp. GENSP01]